MPFIQQTLLRMDKSKKLLRTLKGTGSSSGGTGGTGASGVGIGQGGSNGGASSSSFISDGIVMFLIIVAIVITTVALILCCMWKKGKPSQMSPDQFQSRVEKERSRVMRRASSIMKRRQHPRKFHKASDGVYVAAFKNLDGDEKKLVYNFIFMNDGNGYTITGSAAFHKGDGEVLKIEEGYASYDGQAYWRISNCLLLTSGENEAMIGVSKGKFDFKHNTFSGIWTTSNGVSGTYSGFQRRKEPK